MFEGKENKLEFLKINRDWQPTRWQKVQSNFLQDRLNFIEKCQWWEQLCYWAAELENLLFWKLIEYPYLSSTSRFQDKELKVYASLKDWAALSYTASAVELCECFPLCFCHQLFPLLTLLPELTWRQQFPQNNLEVVSGKQKWCHNNGMYHYRYCSSVCKTQERGRLANFCWESIFEILMFCIFHLSEYSELRNMAREIGWQ